jgi:hypothetical protein
MYQLIRLRFRRACMVAQTRALPSFTGAIRFLTTFMFAPLFIDLHKNLFIWHPDIQFEISTRSLGRATVQTTKRFFQMSAARHVLGRRQDR